VIVNKNAALIVAVLAVTRPLSAQDRPAPAPPQPASERRLATVNANEEPPRPGMPLKVQIVISRWDGDRKVSSQPYTLTVNANPAPTPGRPMGDMARLRIGAEVPVPTITGTQEITRQTGQPAVAPIQYKPIGTNIDCWAAAAQDGRFTLNMTIEDSSVYADDHPQPGTVSSSTTPVFRSFRIQNTAVLRDGQSTQFTSAADKIGGDVVKVDVTLNVLK
jgi:hypothetical protein